MCFLDKNGECWTFQNPEIRAQKNITQGRPHIAPFYDPEDVALKKENKYVCAECLEGPAFCTCDNDEDEKEDDDLCDECGECDDECFCEAAKNESLEDTYKLLYKNEIEESKSLQMQLSELRIVFERNNKRIEQLTSLVKQLLTNSQIFPGVEQKVKEVLGDSEFIGEKDEFLGVITPRTMV